MREGSEASIPSRELSKFYPLGFKMVVEVEPEKWESPISRPDNYKKGDTTKKSFWAKIVKFGPDAESWDDALKMGLRVAVDPSINILNPARAFFDKGKHFVIIDASDVLAVQEG